MNQLHLINPDNFVTADEEAEKKELLGVNTGLGSKPAKPNPFVKIFLFFSLPVFVHIYWACNACGLASVLHALLFYIS